MDDFETHPVGTAATLAELQAAQKYRYIGKDGKPVLARDLEDRIEQLEAALMDANAKIPRFPDHMARIAEAKTAGLPERISAIVAAIQSIPDDMRQYQWQADDNQSFGSKWVRAVVGDNGKGMGRQAIAEVVSHIGVADYIAAANPDSVSLLVAALTRANAATAAAYEVAAQIADDFVRMRERQIETEKSKSALQVDVPQIMRWQAGKVQSKAIADDIRALATPDQTAALDKLIAEAEARVWAEAERIAKACQQQNYPRAGDSEITKAYRSGLSSAGQAIAAAIEINALAASKKGGAA